MMKTIAIMGASNDRSKFGNKAVRAFVQQGYDGVPRESEGGNHRGFACVPTHSVTCRCDRNG